MKKCVKLSLIRNYFQLGPHEGLFLIKALEGTISMHDLIRDC